MTARTTTLVAAVGTVVAGAVLVGIDGASASAHQPAQSLVLTARYAEATSHFVGKDENTPTVGDEFVDAGPVRSQGKVVGRLFGVCTIVSGSSEATFVTQCISTYSLAHGQIVTTGAEGNSNDTTDAITGGTGPYSYVRGAAETVSGTTAATITLRYLTSEG